MGTIGGNLCLDTRCTYYDQTYEWRQAINFCMKKDGETCWVATSSPKCLAVSSTDTAPMLQALGARVRLVSAARRARRRRRRSLRQRRHALPDAAARRDPDRRRDPERWTAGAARTGSCAAAGRSTSPSPRSPSPRGFDGDGRSRTSASSSAPWRRGRWRRRRPRRCSRTAPDRRRDRRRRRRRLRRRQADGQHRLRAGLAQEDDPPAGDLRAARNARRRHAGTAAEDRETDCCSVCSFCSVFYVRLFVIRSVLS